ncbi:MAG: hypothetical protein ACI9WT_001128, partial [Flavobacterium sp.]
FGATTPSPVITTLLFIELFFYIIKIVSKLLDTF